ncbi:hypothetical protein JOL79_13845 [Microbispora sp. RL4-1S]|uniref:DUF5666 domain-containing protein n=1 Tax=Microbispora oryzae TaxID=2806554 RepID=A0A940WL38_9ACTN|nr:DUF5666 domain-containing protein [Microbispora oryzae]MBP2704898.1 hypothetical protein [Microbispora oryzae]
MKKVARAAAAVTLTALVSGSAALVATESGASTTAPAPAPVHERSAGRAATPGNPAAGRHRRFGMGVHGEATFRRKNGTFAERTWQRGTVTAKGASALTVRSADGVTWTWTIDAGTRIRHDGGRAALDAVAVGDAVRVLGAPVPAPSNPPSSGGPSADVPGTPSTGASESPFTSEAPPGAPAAVVAARTRTTQGN